MAKLPVIQMYESAEDEAVELTSLLNNSTGTSAMSYNDCNRGISCEQDASKECNSMKSEGQHLDKESNKDISKAVVTFDRLIVDTINPTTLHLDWAPCNQCLSVSGYKIRYNIKDNASYNEIFVTPGITSYTVSGLKPNTEYDVCVNAMDQHQRVICSCGNVTQRTDPMMKDKKRYDVPYIAVITAACLLIIAALVPLTFLLLRECVKCDTSMNTSQDKHTSDPLTQPNVMVRLKSAWKR
ncbi:hypothetical protein CHS0354_014281 [Potamilus streckersoni]|uniref:Fibronectin type-III domain-containing protein n=1 Tax=Potamilus streckersoni TaxID=2493646 RepID=A0AAE0SKR4_9BIVA|nr:hypothetical protein CHS0354_014281 [Potamilus streckersoni]